VIGGGGGDAADALRRAALPGPLLWAGAWIRRLGHAYLPPPEPARKLRAHLELSYAAAQSLVSNVGDLCESLGTLGRGMAAVADDGFDFDTCMG
jgi:hypothetical protein